MSFRPTAWNSHAGKLLATLYAGQCVQCSIPIGIGAHEPRNGHCSATYKLNCMAVEHRPILLSDTLGKQSFFMLHT